MGHWAWGMGHGAWGMGHGARLRQPKGMGMGEGQTVFFVRSNQKVIGSLTYL
ncbi:hypothetical protein [Microcoleus sp. FACHB-68]|uniref:hypothetical protein n=1 Tax=Microcoleus sp. FACHB-68 TaxID=2692826 RepID=UPI0016863B78|nr:hypothetical protein [Microcoleus sp. FACHB-68]MBD1939384.1 hypothetical protein [Microcoleus sp. FACHB-68]